MHTRRMKKNAKKSRKAQTREIPRSGWRPDVEVLLLLGVVVSALLLVSPAMAQDGEAKVRMVHLSPDAPSVMVELDGEPVEALADVSYRDATGYLPIPAGPHEVAVYATADTSEPVLEVSIAPEAGESYTIAGVGLLEDDTFGARLFQDDAEPVDDKAKVRVIHAVPDVGAATVSVQDGPELFALPGFANASDYAEVDGGTYTLEVTPAGAEEPAFDVPDVSVENGEIYTAFAIGQASEGTLDALLTVDSDNGRVVGPKTLEDTSGDLSLIQSPQAANATNFIPATQPDEDSKEGDSKEGGEKPKDAPDGEKKAEKPAEKESPSGKSSGEESEDSWAPTGAQAPASAATPAPPAPTPVAASPVPVAEVPAQSETYAAPVESAPVSVAPPVYQAPHQAPELRAAPPEPVVVPSVDEVVATTLTQFTGAENVQPPPAPVVPQPMVSVPNVPVETPDITVDPAPVVPNAPTIPTVPDGVSAQSVTQNVTQNVAQTVEPAIAQSGFVAPVPVNPVPVNPVPVNPVPVNPVPVNPVPVNPVPVNPVPVNPVPAGNIVGNFVNTPAIVNSGARRRFVTIRKDWRS